MKFQSRSIGVGLLLLASAGWGATNLSWVRKHDVSGLLDGTYDVVMDSRASLVIAGITQVPVTGDTDAYVVKYDANGNLLWSRSVAGDANQSDVGWQVAVDSSDNVYMAGWIINAGTGLDGFVVKYDPNGNELWRRVFETDTTAQAWLGLAVNSVPGSVCVAGYSYLPNGSADFTAQFYDLNGTPIRTQRFQGDTGGFNDAYDVALDPTGAFIVGGEVRNTATDYDFVTAKYDLNGTEIWRRSFNRSGSSTDFVYAVEANQTGEVAVFGVTTAPVGGGYDVLVLKYGPEGALRWSSTWNGPGNGYDYGFAGGIAPDGTVYASSSISNSAGDTDAEVRRLNGATGSTDWTRVFDSPDWLGDDTVVAPFFLSDGTLLLAGTIYNGWDTDDDVFYARLSTSGQLLAYREYDGGGFAEGVFEIVGGPGGSSYAGGYTSGPNRSDILALRFSEAELVTPSSFTVTRGTLVGGTLADLVVADDLRVRIESRPQQSPAVANAEMVIEGQTPLQTISSLNLIVELNSSGAPSSRIAQRVELLNRSNAWERVDERSPRTTDDTLVLGATGDLNRFLLPGGIVRCRIGWFDRGAITPAWQGRGDRVVWELRP